MLKFGLVKYSTSQSIRVQYLDGDAIVLDRSGSAIHRLQDDAVTVLELVEQGLDDRDVPEDLRASLDELIDCGVVTGSRWSRRKFLLASGAATAGATIVSVGLPSAAAAASVCPGGVTPTDLPAAYGPGTSIFRPGPSTTTITVEAWAGGGGGANDSGNSGGGGGGGGGYHEATFNTVVPCASYSVVVGSGGNAGGGNGGLTDFSGPGIAGVSATGGMGGSGSSGGAGGTGTTSNGTSGMNASGMTGGAGGLGGDAPRGNGGRGATRGGGNPPALPGSPGGVVITG